MSFANSPPERAKSIRISRVQVPSDRLWFTIHFDKIRPYPISGPALEAGRQRYLYIHRSLAFQRSVVFLLKAHSSDHEALGHFLATAAIKAPASIEVTRQAKGTVEHALSGSLPIAPLLVTVTRPRACCVHAPLGAGG